MGVIVDEIEWVEQIYLLEETDLVKGGEDGPDNIQPKQLANRTAWLKNAIRGYVDVTVVNASINLTKEDIVQKLILIDSATVAIECALPELESEDKGVRASIVVGGISKQAAIVAPAIQVGSAPRAKIFLGSTDRLELIWLGDKWIALDFNANILTVGGIDYGYSIKTNTIIANGAALLRSDYPRLWEYVQTLGPSLISDTSWLNTPGRKGFFSSGNGFTTFRIPDLRSMFIRGLDLGAGITNGRNNENAGGYEADEFKSHNHSTGIGSMNFKNDGGSGPDLSSDGGDYRSFTSSSTGGTESRPKNIGLIPLIKI